MDEVEIRELVDWILDDFLQCVIQNTFGLESYTSKVALGYGCAAQNFVMEFCVIPGVHQRLQGWVESTLTKKVRTAHVKKHSKAVEKESHYEYMKERLRHETLSIYNAAIAQAARHVAARDAEETFREAQRLADQKS